MSDVHAVRPLSCARQSGTPLHYTAIDFGLMSFTLSVRWTKCKVIDMILRCCECLVYDCCRPTVLAQTVQGAILDTRLAGHRQGLEEVKGRHLAIRITSSALSCGHVGSLVAPRPTARQAPIKKGQTRVDIHHRIVGQGARAAAGLGYSVTSSCRERERGAGAQGSRARC